ncbi:ribosomal protein S27AE [Gracilibacillus halotolerans]|uniref:Ribosomal protein S27AE n=1 Tax=Gracilibacillus halotolerans TaxID=74386 RepID=A0A841RKE0_9BACI|nr:hypothetical protein [Gracilibacillus halotolerans]MBB6512432.1 ribosomal protein S27AE [Gracilibacillus halotolerans]
MQKTLNVIGIIFIVLGGITGIIGFLSSEIIVFFLSVLGGVATGVFFIALSEIIDNQLHIIYQLQVHNERTKQLHMKHKTCPDCNHVFDEELLSCPNCGHRNF